MRPAHPARPAAAARPFEMVSGWPERGSGPRCLALQDHGKDFALKSERGHSWPCSCRDPSGSGCPRAERGPLSAQWSCAPL